MPAGPDLAETTIFVPGAVLGSVIGELRSEGLTVLPHPTSAIHHNADGDILGQMVDVLGLYPSLAQTLARTLSANGLEGLNNPVVIFPFE